MQRPVAYAAGLQRPAELPTSVGGRTGLAKARRVMLSACKGPENCEPHRLGGRAWLEKARRVSLWACKGPENCLVTTWWAHWACKGPMCFMLSAYKSLENCEPRQARGACLA